MVPNVVALLAIALIGTIHFNDVMMGVAGSIDQQTSSSSSRRPSLASDRLIDLIDTRIGSGGFGFGVGGVNPGPQVPYGAVKLGPDTDTNGLIFLEFNHFGGYFTGDTHIRGFSHTHMVGAGIHDLGNIGIMPLDHIPTTAQISSRDHAVTFSSKYNHSSETAAAADYQVTLDDPNVVVELSVAGTHTGLHRYKYQKIGRAAVVSVDVCHTTHPGDIKKGICADASIEVDVQRREIRGYVLNRGGLSGRNGMGVGIWFTARFVCVSGCQQALPVSSAIWQDFELKNVTSVGSSKNGSLGAYFNFGVSTQPIVVEIRVGLSFVNASMASINLDDQAPTSLSFDSLRTRSIGLWEQALSSVDVDPSGISRSRMVSFATGLYHTFLTPTIYSETGGVYMGFDNLVHTWPYPSSSSWYQSDMSIWDTHRSQAPWLILAAPERARDVARSLVQIAKDGGDVPRWPLANVYTNCMSGSHGHTILADTWVKGIHDFDLASIYPIMYKEATQDTPHGGRDDITEYIKLGYVPQEGDRKSASATLENAYNDFTISQVAGALGKMDDQKMFAQRSLSYRNIWDADRQLMCPRYRNGSVICPSPLEAELPYPFEDRFYTEGDAWQWLWFVPHDPYGLVSLFPSTQAYINKLDDFFNKSTYWHTNDLPNPWYWAGNEPDLLAPWQFVFGNRADLTQKWTRWLLDKFYTDKWDGIPGNDDYGTMSAWATFASLGFYPISATTTYIIGSPVFPKATIHRPGIGDIVIIAHDTSSTNIYVQKMILNGKVTTKPFIDHSDIAGAATLEFWMGSQPSLWGQ